MSDINVLALVGGAPSAETAKYSTRSAAASAPVDSASAATAAVAERSRAATVALRGQDESRQLILTGHVGDGRLQDLTGDVKYEVADPKVARVTSAGRVLPQSNGSTTITARYGQHAVTVNVAATVKKAAEAAACPLTAPWPTLTRSACHLRGARASRECEPIFPNDRAGNKALLA